jgi:PDDEXK-like domain of unknown function (DUF3799)
MASQTDVASVEPAGATASDAYRAYLVQGIHKITAERYHADPCPRPSLSSHLAHLLVSKSPRHAWLAHPRLNPAFAPENDPKFDIGRAAHSLMLEGAGPFEIIDAPNWKSEAARDERREVYRIGKIPLLEHEWSRVSAFVKSVRFQLRQTREAKFAFRRGKPERTLIWKEGPIWCRARIDWLLLRPRAQGAIEIWDFKTTEGSAAPQAWTNGSLFALGFDMQAAFYKRGVEKHYGRGAIFRFVVAETSEPFGVSIVTLSPTAQEIADFEVQMAIDAWTTCQRRGKWPGYSSRTYSADAPIWKAKELEAWKTQRVADQDSRVDPFALSVALWKP